jgi:glycosyltransferase involved in cell wall biosynthesis
MKKIIHVITGLDAGGAEAVLLRLVTNDKKNKHLVISLKDLGYFGKKFIQEEIEVEVLELNNLRTSFTGLIKLFRIIRIFKPDLLICWMYHACLVGGIIGKIAGVKNILWNFLGTIQKLKQKKLHTRIVFILCIPLSYLIPTKIICCAVTIREICKSYGFQSKKFKVIFNGYDIEEFKRNLVDRERIRTELSISDETLLIGMIARWHPQKNHSLLIRSLELILARGENFKCLLMGEGMQNDTIASLINETGLKELVILRKEHSNVPAVMSALDIHILSSGFGEGFPNVLAEAMACEVPCITTDIGDSEIVIGETGWLVRENSFEEMADRISEALILWKDKKKWLKRSKEARERIINNYQISRMVDSYRELY